MMNRWTVRHASLIVLFCNALAGCSLLPPCRTELADPRLGGKPCPSDHETPLDTPLINPVDLLSGAVAAKFVAALPGAAGYAARVAARKAALEAERRLAEIAAQEAAKAAAREAADAAAAEAIEALQHIARSAMAELMDQAATTVGPPTLAHFRQHFVQMGEAALRTAHRETLDNIEGWTTYLEVAARNRLFSPEMVNGGRIALEAERTALQAIKQIAEETGIILVGS